MFLFHLVDPDPASGNFAAQNRIENTVVENNIFTGNTLFTVSGGSNGLTSSTVSNTEFVDNVVIGGAIGIEGGRTNATGNIVAGVALINDTVLGNIRIFQNSDGGSGNQVIGVTARNVIFDPNGFDTDLTPDQVSFSLIGLPGYAGNGNKAGDPAFVNRASGDLHLRPASPAIDAGSAAGAPATDLECRPRAAAPDMGAYEFGAPEAAVLTLVASSGGRVDVAPRGFDCGPRKSFVKGTVVTLMPTPDPGWVFAGWGGATCEGATLTMSNDRFCKGHSYRAAGVQCATNFCQQGEGETRNPRVLSRYNNELYAHSCLAAGLLVTLNDRQMNCLAGAA